MRDTILKLTLWGGHFEVAAILKLSVNDVVDGIGAPIERVERTAARTTTATPFIRKQNLGAIVVECRGVPVGEPGVCHDIDSLWISGIGDIEQNAITGAGSCRDVLRGENGNVMTLIRSTGFLCVITVIATAP